MTKPNIWNYLQGTPFKQSLIDAKGVKTRAIEAGDGIPLIFLHGTGGHAEAYCRNIASHAKHFHVYAIDMVGHGYSDQPDLDYTIDDFANHLKDFVDSIGADKAIISGESLGGFVASVFAINWPERVEKLVLNTGVLAPPPPKGRAELQDVLDRARKVIGKPTRDDMRKRMEWLMYDPKDVTDELVEVRYQIYNRPDKVGTYKKISENILGEAANPEGSKWLGSSEHNKKIKAETLVLWTDHNPGQPVETAEEVASLIPNAKLVVMKDCAHWPMWEDPETFDRLHLDFLLGRG